MGYFQITRNSSYSRIETHGDLGIDHFKETPNGPQIELNIEKQGNHQLFWNVNYLVSSQHHSMDEQQDLRFAAVFVS
jgi:hypothetical protein